MRVQFYIVASLSLFCVAPDAFAQSPTPIGKSSTTATSQQTLYVVDGLPLGGHVRPESEAYKQYQCGPSEKFPGFTWCHKERTEKTKRGEVTLSNSILHSQDGTALYVNRYIEPAFFEPNEVRNEIDRLSAKFGEHDREYRLPERRGLPNAIIAVWGKIDLGQLDASDVSTIASGGSVKGLLVSFLGDLQRSAKAKVPIYRLAGGPGYLWAATFNQDGRGVLRFLAVDASQISSPIVSVPLAPSSKAISASDISPKQAENLCQSSDTNQRMIGCTSVINGRGFGSRVDLVDAFDGRCRSFNDLQQYERGAADCRASIALNPRYSYAYTNLGTSLMGLGDASNAIAAFTKAIELKSDFIWSYVGRGKAFHSLGKDELARKDFESALLLDPTNQQVQQAIADLDQQSLTYLPPPPSSTPGQSTVPEPMPTIPKPLPPDDPFVTDCDAYAASDSDPQRKGEGVSFDKINPAKAIPACLDALKDYPNSVRFQYQIGRAYEKTGQFNEAIRWYRKAADQGSEAARASLEKIENK